MPTSISLDRLCCHVTAAVFSFCVGPRELHELGLVGAAQSTAPPTRIHTLRFLRRLCSGQPAVAQRLSDMLDLEYLDTVLKVRDLNEDELHNLVELWTETPQGSALPGLIWALGTDPRPAAQRAGVMLAQEATWLGCQQLVAESNTQPQAH